MSNILEKLRETLYFWDSDGLRVPKQRFLLEECYKEIQSLKQENTNLHLKLSEKKTPSKYLLQAFYQHFSTRKWETDKTYYRWYNSKDLSQPGFEALLEFWKFELIEFCGYKYRLTKIGAEIWDKEDKNLNADNFCHY